MNGGEVRLAFHQEPEHLNPYLFVHGAAGEIGNFLFSSGFVEWRSNGPSYPLLAREVPTVENGGISPDYQTITYRLRDGLRWSDGFPITSEDARFTWAAINHIGSSVASPLGYEEIETIDCPDQLTVRIRLRRPYAPFRLLFPCILPRHAAGEPADMRSWPFNQRPVGANAFRFEHWERGSHLQLRLNPHYRLRPDLPYLERVAIHFVPTVEDAIEMLAGSSADVVGRVTEAHLPALREIPHACVLRGPGPSSERLVLNLADPSSASRYPGRGVPRPHPILGDRRVREAIELAIDKTELVRRLLHGEARPGTCELHVGRFRCEVPASDFDPERAERLLCEAGWRRGADGVQVGHSEPAPVGRRLQLQLHTIEGNTLRHQTVELLARALGAIGVEVVPEYVPAWQVFDTSPLGRLRRGRFDLLLCSFGPEWDPHGLLSDFFGSWSIPSLGNGYAGWNYSRWVSPRADAAITRGRTSHELAARRAAYRDLMGAVAEDRPHVYLYSRDNIYAVHRDLCGPRYDMWDYLSWNCAHWHWHRPGQVGH
jgi:peptide/nickel transport system substrate-binding protein